MQPDRISTVPHNRAGSQAWQQRRPYLAWPSRPGTVAIWSSAAFGLLAIYMLSPALTATHVEGFTALIQLDAIAAQLGLLDRADLLYPVQTEYFYGTRQGVVLLLRGLMYLTGTDGDALFRVLTLLCFVVFLGSTAVVARRHSSLGWPAILGSLLLVPGLFELGFYFSDGVVSVAFGMLGFALLPRSAKPRITAAWVLRGALAGGALGMAVLARTDSVLLLPLAAGLAWLDQPRLRHLLALGVLGGAAMAAVFAVSYAVSGVTVLQAFQIGQFFDQLHYGARSRLVRIAAFVLFFGLPGLVLVATGAVQSLRKTGPRRKKELSRLLVLVVLPLPVLAFALKEATELRQIYPLLAPFVVMHCGRGVEWVWTSLTSGVKARAWVGAAIVLGMVLAWVLPPVFVPVRDGPRALLGRLWSPPLWRAWQERVTASLDDVDALVAEAGRIPRLVAITAHFNSDHYFQLRAWQRGWRPLRPEETADGCVGGVQVWRKDGHELIQVRVENPYALAVLTPQEFFIPLQLAEALKCPAVIGGAPAYLSDFSPPLFKDPVSELLRTNMPALPPALVSFGWPISIANRIGQLLGSDARVTFALPLFYGVNRTAPLSHEQLAEARDLATQEVSHDLSLAGEPHLPDSAEYNSLFHTRFWQTRAGGTEKATH